MDAKEAVKKYGVWIVAGALVLYLVYRQTRGPARQSLIGPAPPGAAGISSEQYRLESERLRAAGALDLERLRLTAAEEAARRKAELDRFNLEQQIAAQRRAIDAQQRGQTLGLIGQLANSIANLFKGQQQQQRPGTPPISGGSSGGSTPQRGQLPPAPYYPIPEPVIDVFGSYTPSYPQTPEYIPLRIDDWGEAPQFQMSGLDLDTGATFYDMWAGSDFNYGYGTGGADYSAYPELNYNNYSDPYDVGAGGDFYYGYGGGGGGDYYVESSGNYDDYGYGSDE